MGDDDVGDVLRTAARRQRAFAAFEDGGGTRADIQAALGVSRSTAFRVVNTFESLGLIVSRNGTYELTPFGRVVHEETTRATETIRVASRLSSLLDALERTEEPIELQAFTDATLTEREPGDPHSPIRRFLSLLDDASRVREFTPTLPDPAYQQRLYERVRDGLRVAVLYPPSAVERLWRESGDEFERTLEEGDLTVRVGDPPTFRLVVADDHVYLGGYNDDASSLRVVADTAVPEVRDWADRCFESRWECATPFETYAERVR